MQKKMEEYQINLFIFRKEAIINEINCMRVLNHDNIVRLEEVYETKNSLYMVIELLEGGSLYDELKDNLLLSSKDIKTILFGILRG